MAKNDFLQKRKKAWYVRVAVPTHLRERIGKTELIKSLGTRDFDEAARKRWAVVAELQGVIEAAENEMKARAVELGRRVRTASPVEGEDGYSDRDREVMSVQTELLEHTGLDPQVGRALHRVATAQAAPLQMVVERFLAWMAEAGPDGKRRFAGQTIAQRRFGLGLVEAEFGSMTDASSLTARQVASFVERRIEPGRTQKTANRIISDINACWKWAMHPKRSLITGENPWKGQGDFSKAFKAQSSRKRSYTDDEVLKLLRADMNEAYGRDQYPRALHEIVRLGFVTGARLDELAGLEVAEVFPEDRAIKIGDGKTENAIRLLPLVPAVWPIVAKRLAEAQKAGGRYLFPEIPPGGPDKKHGWTFSKCFTKARRRILLGKDDRALDDRSLDFHSTRRWFSTQLHNATSRIVMLKHGDELRPQLAVSQDAYDTLMGHKHGTLAKDGYSAGLVPQAVKDAVEHGLAPQIDKRIMQELGRPFAPRSRALAAAA